jgi:hypothetical protein
MSSELLGRIAVCRNPAAIQAVLRRRSGSSWTRLDITTPTRSSVVAWPCASDPNDEHYWDGGYAGNPTHVSELAGVSVAITVLGSTCGRPAGGRHRPVPVPSVQPPAVTSNTAAVEVFDVVRPSRVASGLGPTADISSAIPA